ncbi:MAG: trehalose-6-phosphate synthase, partial [Vicinamibacterales bacterium]
AQELTDALIINPNDLDSAAEAIMKALTMAPQEQRRRMRAMRDVVANADAARWAERILADATRDHERSSLEAGPARLSEGMPKFSSRPLAASDVSAS